MTDRVFYAILRRSFALHEYMTVKALEDETGTYIVRHNVVPPYPDQPQHYYFTRKDVAQKALRKSGLVKRGEKITMLEETWTKENKGKVREVA